MKIERRSYVEQVIKSNPSLYKDYDILLMTPKCSREANKVNIKRKNFKDDVDVDVMLDEYYRSMDMVLSTLPNRKFLLLNSEMDHIIFEYNFNGLMFSIKTHLFTKNDHFIYDYVYINGCRTFDIELIKGEQSKIDRLNKYAVENGFNSIDGWVHSVIYETVLRQVVFIELSKEMVKYRIIQPKSKSGQIMKGNYVNNLSDIRLVLVDSLWYTKTIGIGNFEVSGHFRLQNTLYPEIHT